MADMFTLATRPRHQWGPSRTLPANPLTGDHERKVRCCISCGLAKITVMPKGADGFRSYAWINGPEFEADVDPVCAPGGVAKEAEKVA